MGMESKGELSVEFKMVQWESLYFDSSIDVADYMLLHPEMEIYPKEYEAPDGRILIFAKKK